jgi:hypothetical protein
MQRDSKMDEEYAGQNSCENSPVSNVIPLYDTKDEDVQNHFIEGQVENLSLESDQMSSLVLMKCEDSASMARDIPPRNENAQTSKYAYSESKMCGEDETGGLRTYGHCKYTLWIHV